MLDRNEAARELLAIHQETEDLPALQRLASRIERISELHSRASPNLKPITASEALMLAQGSMPIEHELHRISRVEYTLVWSNAYSEMFGKNSDWLLEIQNLFEWARTRCEEAGEIDFDYVFTPRLGRKGAWVSGVRY